MSRLARSIDCVGTFAVLRSDLEEREKGALFGLDFAMVRKAPSLHLVGVHNHLFDPFSQIFRLADTRRDHLKKLEVGVGDIVPANLSETDIGFRIRPNDGDEIVLHGDLLPVGFDDSRIAEGAVTPNSSGGYGCDGLGGQS